MLVSWNWLKDYLPLDLDPAEVAQRLAMAGLNHEGSEEVGDDLAIDIEVTSNRPDCLGHIGIAREIAVLFDRPLQVKEPAPSERGTHVGQLARVTLESPDLCPHYTARVIRGVRVGESPAWLASRLRTIGINVINNVVDITNYVLMECGQPLHAFDLDRLRGKQIVVRRARSGEQLEAIDHRDYKLEPSMCVIADAERAVALGGVMGGADTEVSTSTTNLLIESARFAPLAIRTTARTLSLQSPSSYRFERGVDPFGVDWASRRCCELVLELCGGELAEGVLSVGQSPQPRPPVVLRLEQLARILGIEVPAEEVQRILTALGMQAKPQAKGFEVVPPSWRGDVSREVDLVEEVGRIYGYDKIPEDVSVPMAPSHRSDQDRVLEQVRHVLTAAGADEAVTASMVPVEWCQAFSPWSDAPPLQSITPMLKGADTLRTSIVPSLLEARRLNQALSNPDVQLFETAHIYLPRAGKLPHEQMTLAIVSGQGFYEVKGIVEAILHQLHATERLEVQDANEPFFEPGRAVRLQIGGSPLGVLGELADASLKRFSLRSRTTVAELDVSVLVKVARLVPQFQPQSPYPAISQDLNLILDEGVRWAELARTVWQAGGDWLEQVEYRETYRNPQQDGPGKKRLLLSITFRAADKTLTGEEANTIRDRIVAACQQQYQAKLVG